MGLYNKVWKEGKLPIYWKEAVIIPIKKPGEDAADPRIQAVSAYLSYWEGDGKNDNRKINPLCRK